MLDAAVFKSSFNRPNLFYEIRPKIDVAREIIKYIKQNEGKSGIIYCLSRKKVEELAELARSPTASRPCRTMREWMPPHGRGIRMPS